jgi:acyl carrier protein
MPSLPEITATVRGFIAKNFVMGTRAALADDQSLMDAGVIDSTGVLELTEYLSTEFGIEIPDADLVPENLDSVANISAYVARRLAGQGAAS